MKIERSSALGLLSLVWIWGLTLPHAAHAEGEASVTATDAPAEEMGPTDPIQQFNLGVIADNAGDHLTALNWYQRAAIQGYFGAEHRLGYLFEHGQGVSQNLNEAQRWYQKAAKKGYGLAQYNLAQMYDVAKNPTEAVHWYTEAGNQGNTAAQYELALHYESGRGVKTSLQEAFKWSELAAKDGAPTHVVNRDRLARLLPEEEVVAIRKMLDEWQQVKDGKRAPAPIQ